VAPLVDVAVAEDVVVRLRRLPMRRRRTAALVVAVAAARAPTSR
jgi:hypothetical protein